MGAATPSPSTALGRLGPLDTLGPLSPGRHCRTPFLHAVLRGPGQCCPRPSGAVASEGAWGAADPRLCPAWPPAHFLEEEEEEEGGVRADESKCHVACPSPISPEPDSRADEAQPERP